MNLENPMLYSTQVGDLWLVICGYCGLHKGLLGRYVIRSKAVSTENNVQHVAL